MAKLKKETIQFWIEARGSDTAKDASDEGRWLSRLQDGAASRGITFSSALRQILRHAFPCLVRGFQTLHSWLREGISLELKVGRLPNLDHAFGFVLSRVLSDQPGEGEERLGVWRVFTTEDCGQASIATLANIGIEFD